MISIAAYRSLRAPSVGLELADLSYPGEGAPVILDAFAGARPTSHALSVWPELSECPYPSSPPTTCVLQSSRDTFKSSINFDLAIDRVLRFDASKHVARGSEAVSLIVSVTKKQASAIIRNNVEKAKAFASLLGGFVEERGLTDGAEVVFRIPGLDYVPIVRAVAADEATIRGGAFCYVGWSEAGWFPSGRNENTLGDLRVAVVPRGVAQFPYFLELAESTNGPPSGWFHETCTNRPANVLLVHPKDPRRVNPAIDLDKLRATLSPEEYEQEIECVTWGLKEAAFIRSAAPSRCIDREGEVTPKGRRILPAILAVDVANVGDRIAFVVAYWTERVVSPGNVVRVLVVEEITIWTPSRDNPITTERIAEHAVNLARAFGGCPIVADGRSFVDLSAHAEKRGAKVCRTSDDAERKAAIAGGGLVVVERGMHPKHQHDRWTTLRDLVNGGRLVLPDTREGHEAVRELTGLRATQMASAGNGFLRVEAASGETDDVADCLALAAECAFLRPPVRADGLRKRRVFDMYKDGSDARVTWELVDDQGNVVQQNVSPDVAHRDFATWCVHQIAIGASDDEMETFAKARLGIPESQALRPGDYGRLVEQLVREGVVARESAPVGVVLREDPMEKLKRHARRW